MEFLPTLTNSGIRVGWNRKGTLNLTPKVFQIVGETYQIAVDAYKILNYFNYEGI